MTPSSQQEDAVIKYSTQLINEKSQNLALYLFLKRIMDFTSALSGIILLTPLFILIAILIKLEDPKGSVFFYQTRVGKDEKPFRMYKFRSMVSNAEEKLKDLLDKNEIKGAMFKMKDDPRITKVGKFIRKTSLDELPQFVNILKGDMSLVGPRPPLPREVAEYNERDKLRLTVTPGCTGLWQVGGRNQLTFEEMVDLDLKYIEKRSILLDVIIIIKTVKSIFFSKDAY